MSWYKTGTVTVTNGSAAVVGASTLWVDVGTLNAGDIFRGPDGNDYEVLSFQSNTGLTLASNYLGASLAGQAYDIIPIGLLPSALALQVKTTLDAALATLAAAQLATSFVDGATPSGTIDSTTGSDGNGVFTLAFAPSPAASLVLIKTDLGTGVVLVAGEHYNLSGQTITYTAGNYPVAPQTHRAWYRK